MSPSTDEMWAAFYEATMTVGTRLVMEAVVARMFQEQRQSLFEALKDMKEGKGI